MTRRSRPRAHGIDTPMWQVAERLEAAGYQWVVYPAALIIFCAVLSAPFMLFAAIASLARLIPCPL